MKNSTGSESLDEQLWRIHATELVRYASLLVGPHDAHDVVSSVFLKASRAMRGEVVEHPRAYLFRAVTNEAHNHRRSQSNRWKRDLREVATTALAAKDSQIDVRRAVAELSIRQRAVIYLAYWEDMTEHDVADFLHLSPGSVRRHLFRARAHLRKALRDRSS